MAEITREDLERRVKRRENLKDMDLSGLNLDDLAMEGAIFRKRKLTGTTFNQSDGLCPLRKLFDERL